jgi:hypothetical protein
VDRVLHCDCGFEARADDEEGLVAEVQRHARDAHGMALTDKEALLLVVQAEPVPAGDDSSEQTRRRA